MSYKDKSQKTAYQNKFIKQAYDRINLTVPKGQKEVIQASAAECGESLNEYIKKAISERMERDQAPSMVVSVAQQELSKNADTPILQSTSETESKPDPHRIARETIEQQIADDLLIEKFPDWYINEVADNPQKRERLLAYAVEHEDENSCCRQIVKCFRGMM